MARQKESETKRPAKRRYRGGIQAEVAALSRKRILEATVALYEERWLDQITLEQIASRAGVTVQTVIRHFGTKDRLFKAAGEETYTQVKAQRDSVPVGDVPEAVRVLVDHYEDVGHRVLRSLAEEARHPVLRQMMEEGRTAHHAWVAHVFVPFLEQRRAPARNRLLAQLVTLTDVYAWRLLRHEGGLSRDETEHALLEMLTCLLEGSTQTKGTSNGE